MDSARRTAGWFRSQAAYRLALGLLMLAAARQVRSDDSLEDYKLAVEIGRASCRERV